MKKFVPLYKQTNTGAIQQWTVSTNGTSVTTEYGQVEGKKQTTIDTVKGGKNLGKANATTPEQQAEAQAQQSFDAKLKEGYVENIKLAAEKKNTRQAVEPMLAHPIENKEKYVTFPALAQPKLDGLRCIAIIKNGKARLFSRSQKEYATTPHIVAELETLFANEDIILDGELYNHEFKGSFNTIIHIVKRDSVHDDHKKIEYHMYDVVAPGNYNYRTAKLVSGKYCHIVQTVRVNTRGELDAVQAACVAQGYEGCMYRNLNGEYEHKRSTNLLKVKTFQDAEFLIVGAEEGAGKLMGAIGAFLFITEKGVSFKAKPACTLEQSKEYWKNRRSFLNEMGTVKFQNYTPDGAPRFPVFKCIRKE